MFPGKSNLSKLLKGKAFICFALYLIFSSFPDLKAQGNLLLTPKRVVFEGSKRSEELNLANTGKDSATYNISFIQIRMKDDGSMENITEPDSAQLFADKYLRFFPRTVTLAPNEAQTVKVQLRKTEEMAPGEYRSHLYFRAVPNVKPLGEPENKKDAAISVKLVPVFGLSMPVIIRIGEPDTRISISELSVGKKDSIHVLKLRLNRKGNMSVYGDISVNHISPAGKITPVGVIKGLAVYTPNAFRRFSLPLNKMSDINYRSGKLHIVYADQSGKAAKLAEAYMNLN